MFTHARLAFEFLPAGKVRPTVAVDSAPLLHDQRALKGELPSTRSRRRRPGYAPPCWRSRST